MDRDKHEQDWQTKAIERDEMVQNDMRSWFLWDAMDYEILIQALFNDQYWNFLFGLNHLKWYLDNISHIMSFKAVFTL